MTRRILDPWKHFAQPLYASLIERFEAIYRNSHVVQGIVQALLLLIGVLILDRMLGFPVTTRTLYILPIWLATRKAGLISALVFVVAISAMLTSLDHHNGIITQQNLAIQATLRLGALLAVTLMIYGVERRLTKARVQALHDSLTGVLNRTALEQYASYHIQRAHQNEETVVLAVVDCDRFKQINDKYGHTVGDFLLRLLARHLETATRASGLVARTGGDEFVVLMRNLSMEDAKRRFERINQSFIRTTEDRGCRASISYGLASLGIDGINLDDLIHAADKRMYDKKAIRYAAALLQASHQGTEIGTVEHNLTR